MWKHPFTCIVSGPTSCGKSTFTEKFISQLNYMVDTPIDEIIYCSPIVKKYNHHNIGERPIKYYDEVPHMDTMNDGKKRLLILDDMMREISENVVDLFTKNSHHYSISLMFLMQNFFAEGRGIRTISLNAHYIVCFKNPRDRQQIMYLSKQVLPDNFKFVQEAFTDATENAYGYLLFDLTQTTPDYLRYRTSIFADDQIGPVIYVPKNAHINEMLR